jgi:hypothetical protein
MSIQSVMIEVGVIKKKQDISRCVYDDPLRRLDIIHIEGDFHLLTRLEGRKTWKTASALSPIFN